MGEAEDGQWLDPHVLNAKMEQEEGVVLAQLNVEYLDDHGDSLSSGDMSFLSIDLDDCKNLYCSSDYYAPDD